MMMRELTMIIGRYVTIRASDDSFDRSVSPAARLPLPLRRGVDTARGRRTADARCHARRPLRFDEPIKIAITR